MDVRPVITRVAGEIGTRIAAGADARVDRLVAEASDVLETAHRLGVRDLGTSARPLVLDVTHDASYATTPMFLDLDRMVFADVPVDERARSFLRSGGVYLAPDTSWVDLSGGAVTAHEIGHGAIGELVPWLGTLPPRDGAWRLARYEQSAVGEALADTFAAIHRRNWTMDLAGVPLRDASTGAEYIANGSATVDQLNHVRAFAREYGRDVGGMSEGLLEGSKPHHFASLLSPAFARVEAGAGWDALEAVYSRSLARMRETGGAVDVPVAARETARAAIEELGRADDTARSVRAMLMSNGAMG